MGRASEGGVEVGRASDSGGDVGRAREGGAAAAPSRETGAVDADKWADGTPAPPQRHLTGTQEVGCTGSDDDSDGEVLELVRAELAGLQAQRQALLREAVRGLLPRDEADERGCIIEVRAGEECIVGVRAGEECIVGVRAVVGLGEYCLPQSYMADCLLFVYFEVEGCLSGSGG